MTKWLDALLLSIDHFLKNDVFLQPFFENELENEQDWHNDQI